MPFVLHSQPTGVFESRAGSVAQMADTGNRRYAEIMKDIEDMIDDHSKSGWMIGFNYNQRHQSHYFE